jgi:predicted PurR-regulated permease PerM
LGTPLPYPWAVLMFLFDYIPFVGAVSGIALLKFMAVVTRDSIGYAFLAPLSYEILSLLESEIVKPQIVGRQLQLNAVAIGIRWHSGLGCGALQVRPLQCHLS